MNIDIKDLLSKVIIINTGNPNINLLIDELKKYCTYNPLIINASPFKFGSHCGASIENRDTNWYFHHHRAIKLARALNYPYTIILEDTATPVTGWDKKLKDVIKELPDTVDVLRLGGYCSSGTATIDTKLYNNLFQMGAHSYIVFKKYYCAYEHIANNVLAIPDSLLIGIRDQKNDKREIFGVKNNIFNDLMWNQNRDPDMTSDCPRIIYQFWTGENVITENRKKGLLSLRDSSGIRTKIISGPDIYSLELPEHPFHPAYKYLGNWHKADYLRMYTMHFYGGGYSDIKRYSKDNNWSECFDLMEKNKEIDIIGAEEQLHGTIKEYDNPETIKKLLILCFIICRRRSKFTEKWLRYTEDTLDKKYDQLRTICGNIDGDTQFIKGYPIGWNELLCRNFHKVCLEQHKEFPDSVSNLLNDGYDRSLSYR